MKNILVTGGAGFIGSNFVHYLLENYGDIRVVNLDLLTYAGNLDNLADISEDKRYTFAKGDIHDRELVNELFDRYDFDTVVNFAAESHVDRSITNPDIFLTTNILGTQTLLDAAKNHWKLDANDKSAVEAQLKSLKELVDKTDPNNVTEEQAQQLKDGRQKLMGAAQKLFEKMYQQSAAQQQAGPQGQAGPGPQAGPQAGPDNGSTGNNGGSKPYGDDVVDGDYKEV